MAGHQPRRIQQRAVAADGDDEIGAGREGLFRTQHDAAGFEGQAHAGVDQHRHAANLEVRGQAQHAFGNAQIFGVAHQRDGLKYLRHDRL